MADKMIRNILSGWRLYTDRGEGATIVGTVAVDAPDQGVVRGQEIRTTYIQRIYLLDDGTRVAETVNSLYILVDEPPFGCLR